MAKGINKLSAKFVKGTKETGRYSDGGGLYLQVDRTGIKSWLYRYMIKGKSREMGLGSIKDTSLADARTQAQEYRLLVRKKVDPITERDKEKAEQIIAQEEEASKRTFKQCKDEYLKSQSSSWKNKKHIQQWENTLEAYAVPFIGNKNVDEIDLKAVKQILDPIWKTKTETANRVRGRIEKILDWAKVQGLREGDNPARWKGNLSETLPAPSKIKKVRHMPSMPYNKVSAFIQELDDVDTIGSKALKFLILTAARSSEVRLAQWDEIDLEKEVWTIPDERMKAKKQHTVPLSDEVISLLKSMPRMTDNPYVFPGLRSGKPISDMTLTKILRTKEIKDVTVHGFRSSFRDWAGEQTNYPRNVIEFSLAHNLKDKVEAAYHRSNLLEKRRPLMDQWAKYCHTPASKDNGKVVKMQRA